MLPYVKCPRGIAKKAEDFLNESGIGNKAFFGPEPEFFIFDSITWGHDMSGSHVKINSEEASWSSSKSYDGGNTGHRPTAKNGYFPVPPIDSLNDIRAEIVCVLEELGIPTEIHHHEVASAGQCEIGTKFSTLITRADWSQTFRYIVQNVAHRYGKTATFMPKPIVGDNGSGMHVHQSIWKDGKNLFAGKNYAGLSKTALHYIGGIIHHAKALNAITNPSTNSYKRLVPGYEAPVILAYSARNRSASIRIPVTQGGDEAARRIEVRFPDAMANPYLAFSAMLMAGIDGIINKIDPGKATDKNLYELSKEELSKIPSVCSSLEEALHNLDKDREFLKRGNVFTDEWIDSFISLKQQEVDKYRMTSHPIEYEMYYSL
jgi:glutamine synthetase